MAHTAFVVRRAVAGDAAAMAEIARRAYEPYLARMGGRRPGPLDADYADAAAGPESWVAVGPTDLPGGFLVLRPGEEGLLLENVAVAPASQGYGFGRALLDLAEVRARSLGFASIWLYTHVTMTENQAIYAARGYAETHRATEHGLARIYYRKPLCA
jgi:ribosomal protein S18 acetylase RimI-like enzyme